jgi:hypothetical protein
MRNLLTFQERLHRGTADLYYYEVQGSPLTQLAAVSNTKPHPDPLFFRNAPFSTPIGKAHCHSSRAIMESDQNAQAPRAERNIMG